MLAPLLRISRKYPDGAVPNESFVVVLELDIEAVDSRTEGAKRRWRLSPVVVTTSSAMTSALRFLRPASPGMRVAVVQRPRRQFLAIAPEPSSRSRQPVLDIAGHVIPKHPMAACPTSEARGGFVFRRLLPCLRTGTAEERQAFHRHHLQEERSNMGIFTKDIKTMEDLLLHGLQDIYYAE